ncbi:MAG: hypothetical protein RRY79_00150 [Clostridia bacterium]
MKKTLTFVLALVFVLSLMSSCAPQDKPLPSTAPNSGSPVKTDAPAASPSTTPEASNLPMPTDLKSDKIYEAMKNSTYYMKATAYIMGMEMNIITAVSGENSENITEVADAASHTLLIDGFVYTLDEGTKTYTKVKIESEKDEEATANDYGTLVFSTKGNSAIAALSGKDNKSYEFEEFTFTTEVDDSSITATLRYYFDGDKLYAMETIMLDMSTIMVITEFSDTIPAGMMVLPEGYTEAKPKS